jgi:branched-chain amino acid transport system ATP-binding protein
VRVPVPLLETADVAVRFGGVDALRGVSLGVPEHGCLAVIGDNGAGKSTLLNVLTGYVTPQRGRVTFRGRDITGLSPRAITRAGIARSFQHPEVFTPYTVLDNLRLAVAAREAFWRPGVRLQHGPFDAPARELLHLLGLDALAGEPARQIPEGARKLLDVALALALRPTLLLMDEPTSGVSTQEKFAIMDTLLAVLRARRITALFIEHDMDVVARYADYVVVMAEGAVVASGAPAAVLGMRAQPAPRPT